MNSSEIVNSASSSVSVMQDSMMTTTTDDEHESHISTAKKIKLSPSADDFKIGGSKEDVSTETVSTKVELLFPNSSRSPEEFALSIDHIRESIFLDCDEKTLMNCRLVSRRWAYYGSKALQKTVIINLQKCNNTHSMKNLIAIINNSTEFPASSFYLHCGKTKRTAQPFFNAHGALIRKIIFEGKLYIDELKEFLLTQAPNLEELHLKDDMDICIRERNSSQSFDPTETKEQRSERERLEELLFDESLAAESKPILKTLKVFKCSYFVEIPEVFIRQILECSPKLVEVVLPADHLHVIVQPTNRLHLLKKLVLNIYDFNIESYETFANHCHEGNWMVRDLRFVGSSGCDKEAPQFDERVASIMRKIVSVSSTICKKLEWGEHPKNFRIPVMPQVEQLIFQYYEHKYTGYPVNILPEGGSLADTFPNLKWLKIRSGVSMQDLPIENIFGDDDPVPVPNVKKVILRFYDFGHSLRQSFHTMFANAVIHNRSEFSTNLNGESDNDGDENDVDESQDEQVNDDESHEEQVNKDESHDEQVNDDESHDEQVNDDESHDEQVNDDESHDEQDNDDESHDEQVNDDESSDEEVSNDESNEDEVSDDESNDEDIDDVER